MRINVSIREHKSSVGDRDVHIQRQKFSCETNPQHVEEGTQVKLTFFKVTNLYRAIYGNIDP